MSKSKSKRSGNNCDQKGTGRNSRQRTVRQQPRKDSTSKRINLDNERISKVAEEEIRKRYPMPHTSTSRDNDLSWYARNVELMNAAASIPFASVLGLPMFGYGSGSQSVHGVMTFEFKPTFGTGDEPYALNQAAKSLYSFEVHANSRNYNYTSADLMILILAGTQPFAMLASMIRAYGLAKTYSEQSTYMPDALLKAQGFKPSDIRANLSNMWFDINEMIARTGQLWIPNTMPLLQRWFWMNSNVYKDADTTISQVYQYVQSRYYIYDETALNTGGCLLPLRDTTAAAGGDTPVFRPGAAHQYTWDTWKTAFNNLMNALLNSEDRGIIFGDILNAFGKERIYAMSSIPVEHRIEPVYSAEVLTQMENIVPTNFVPAGLKQQDDILIPLWEVDAENERVNPLAPTKTILNFHHSSPVQPGEVVIATRLQTLGSDISTNATGPKNGLNIDNYVKWSSGTLSLSSAYSRPAVCGSEVVTDVIIDDQPYSRYPQYNYNEPGMARSEFVMYSQFDWAPGIYGYKYPTTAVPKVLDTPVDVAMDFDNYTTLTVETVQKLHDMALFSLYGMPMF